MKKLLLALFSVITFLLLHTSAHAQQQYVVVASCGGQNLPPGGRGVGYMDITGNICSSAVGGSSTFTWPGTAGLAVGGTTTAGTMPYVNAYIVGGAGTFTWPGTAGNATGGTTTAGTMPYVNNYQVNAIPAGANTIGGVTQVTSPWITALNQVSGVSLGAPVAWGSTPSGNVLSANVDCIAGCSGSGGGTTPFSSNGTYLNAAVNSVSASYALPAAPNILLNNYGGYRVLFKLGTSAAVVVTQATADGVVQPGATQEMAVGSNTYIAFATTATGLTTTIQVVGGTGVWTGTNMNFVSTGATGLTAPLFATEVGGIDSGGLLQSAQVTVAGTSATTGWGVQGMTGGIPLSISATALPLPTGAATAANQEVTAAGTTATSAQGVQGVTGGVPMPITGTVAAASLPLPTGAATAANQEVTAAGASAASAQAVQGVTGGVPMPITGSVTASFSQFAPVGNYSSLSVGATSTRVLLPSGGGTTVAVYNTGTFAAFVQLGNSSVVATALNDQVAPGGFLCFAVGANTYIAGIETAGATTLNISGGSGGCAGSGGGGGGSGGGGGGAVTAVAGAFAYGYSPDLGNATTVLPWSGTGTVSELALLWGIYNNTSNPTGGNSAHYYSAATTNSTNVKPAAGTVYNIVVTQSTTTAMELKLYNLATAPTCSSATGVIANYPIASSAISPGFSIPFSIGKQFSAGISFCLVAFGNPASDTDSGNAALGVTVDFTYQ